MPGFGLRARGTGRSPEASTSTKKVQDSLKETPGPGCAETGPVAPHSSPRRLWHFLRARGDTRPPSSAPAAGTPHGLDPDPPAPPAGGKLLLSAQPGHRDRPLGGRQGGPRGLARSGQAARTHNQWPSRAPDLPGAVRILKGTRTHTHSLGPAGGYRRGAWRSERCTCRLWEVSERAKERDHLNLTLTFHGTRVLHVCLWT